MAASRSRARRIRLSWHGIAPVLATVLPSIALAQNAPSSAPPQAVGKLEASAENSGTVTLHARESQGENLLYKWIQTRGPQVKLENPAAPTIQVPRPQAPETLEFLLVVGNAAGVDSTLVTVNPAAAPPMAAANPATPSSDTAGDTPRADAGDAQVGIVGHRITLNGMRSQPRGELAFRWLQVSGPPVQSPIQDSYILSFVPTQPGSYRFALVVAAGGKISDPSTVDVLVGQPDARAASTAPAGAAAPALQPLAGASPAPPAAAPATAAPLWQFCRSSLQALDGGPQRGEALAQAFESVATRIELYSSFGDAFREISLRLSSIVPEDPAQRAAWIQLLFTPMTGRLIERLRETGIDLARPEAQNQPLTGIQKAALADLYRGAAHGFRAAAAPSDSVQPAAFATSAATDRQGVSRR